MRPATKYLPVAAALLLLAVYLAAGPGGELAAERFGGAILKAAQGKVADPAVFVAARLREAALLASLAGGLALAFAGLCRLLPPRPNSWAILAAAAFAAVNLWVGAAMHTALFWAALTAGGAKAVIAQFSFKRMLLPEHRAPRQILLLGSSQTQAQIDENIFNTQLAGQAWTTELHFPGSRSLDLLLTLRRLDGEPGNDLVCYLSEYYFYPGLYSTAVPYFLSAADLPLLARLGFSREFLTERWLTGLFAQALPLFACREPFADCLLGASFSAIRQARHDTALATNLVVRAGEWAAPFKLDENAARQKRALSAFVEEAGRQKRRLILIEGQVNPVLAERLPPGLRADMKNFLAEIAAANPNVVLVPEDRLPKQPAAVYEDLTHVSKEAQKKFSLWLADFLKERLPRAD